MGHKKSRPTPFADVIASLPDPGPPYRVMGPALMPIRAGELLDPAGTHWRLKRADPDVRSLDRLVRRHDVTVYECYADAAQAIVSADRAAYWAWVEPYYTGTIVPEPGDHSHVRAGIFVDDDDRVMIAFELGC